MKENIEIKDIEITDEELKSIKEYIELGEIFNILENSKIFNLKKNEILDEIYYNMILYYSYYFNKPISKEILKNNPKMFDIYINIYCNILVYYYSGLIKYVDNVYINSKIIINFKRNKKILEFIYNDIKTLLYCLKKSKNNFYKKILVRTLIQTLNYDDLIIKVLYKNKKYGISSNLIIKQILEFNNYLLDDNAGIYWTGEIKENIDLEEEGVPILKKIFNILKEDFNNYKKLKIKKELATEILLLPLFN